MQMKVKMEEQKQIDKRLQALVGQNNELQERVAVLERQNGSLGTDDFEKDQFVHLEQYRNIIENSNAAIGVIRADGTLLMINRTGASLLDSIPERLCNRNIADCVPRELSEMALKGIGKVVTSRKGYKKERMIHIDREGRWIDANVQPVRDSNGEVTGIQFIINDITERKKTESSLRGRVKELNCLYGISRLLQRRGNTLEDILHGIVNLIIPSWEYPLSTCARIILEGLEYKTGNFMETIWKQSRDIKVYGEKRGAVEVYYLEEKPERYEGPFVREERDLINTIADLTGRFIERIHVEEILRIKESAIESSINAIALADLEGNLTYVNPSFITMWGYKGEREVLGKSTVKFWQKEEDALNVISNMKKSGAWVGEMNAQKKDGSLFVTQLSASMVKDERGEPVCMIASFVDITERKNAEEEIKHTRDDYLATTNLTGDIIVKVDTEGRWTFLNDGACKFWGKPGKELLGNVFADYLHPDDHKLIYDAVEKIMNGNTVKALVNRQMTPKGWRAVEWNGAPIYDKEGKCAGFQATGRDITEHIEADNALKESELKYRLLTENMNDVLWTTDLEMNYQYISPSIKQFGYTAEEEMRMSVQQILTPKSFANAVNVLKEELANEGKPDIDPDRTRNLEMERYRKDGSKVWQEAKISFLRDSYGRPVGLIGVSRDITERKRMEEEKAALEEQLRQGEKLRAIGELAGGIAHDFNNMLGAISGYADLIEETNRDEQGNTKDEELQKRIGVISRASDRAADLVAKLLAFSRRGKFRNMPVDIHELVNDVIALLESSIDRKITLEKRFTARNTIVKGDSSQIQNAILNICINACDAMKNGGVLKISTENMTLHKGQYHIEIKAGNYIKLSVRDTGCGMDREMLGRIFEPFYTTKEVGEGTGLGLSSALGTVQSHNGYITVESVIDKGTTFNVYIPLATQKGALEEKVRDKKNVKGTGTILIVDDEDMLRELVEDVLVKCGYTVHTFGDSVKAVSWYKKNYAAVDLVLLDMVMPKMDGLDCFDKMREVNSDVKVILASGYSLNNKVQKLLDRGVMDFVEKPFDRVILSRTIARVLRNGRASKEKSIRKKKNVVK